MMRSLYSGVSGLKNHQTKMDVVGNNIANVNTTGFKRSRTNFQDLLSQNLSGASSPTGTRGGINGMQVGLGVGMASIDTIVTAGNTQYTGASLDMAIEGDGYFVLQNGNSKVYTRAGTFDMDTQGNIISTNNGLKVMGWMATDGQLPSLDINSLSTLKVPIGLTIDAEATTKASYNKNLDASMSEVDITDFPSETDNSGYNFANGAGTKKGVKDVEGYSTSLEVYDSLGNTQSIGIKFIKSGANEWTAYYTEPAKTGANDTPPNTYFYKYNKLGTLTYDSSGNLESLKDSAGNAVAGTSIEMPTYTSQKIETDANTGQLTGFTSNNAEPLNIEIDFANLTQYAASEGEESTAVGVRDDGYAAGSLQTISADSSGVITGSFSNGRTMTLAQVAVACFNNPGGLTSIGGNIFSVSNNSGEAQIGPAGSGGRGTIAPSTLEMSNVNLSDEFTDMIVTQRGFQANSRVITTTDTMLEELINLKR